MFKINFIIFLFIFNLHAAKKLCECKTTNDKQNFEQATFIFNGRLLEKTYEFPNRYYKFSILYKYKGEYTNEEINILTTTDDCAPIFEIGKRYVIYVNKIVEEKNVHLNKCHFYYELTDKNVNEQRHLLLLELSKEVVDPKNDEKPTATNRFKDQIENIHAEEVKDQKY